MERPENKDIIALKKAAHRVAKGRNVAIPSGFVATSPVLGEAAKTLLRRLAASESPQKEWRERLVEHALKDLGVTEEPPGSNSGPRIDEALKFCGLSPGQPWCAAMVSLWLYEMGYKGPWPADKASVSSWEDMARAKGLVVPTSSARRGDIVTFQFDADPQGDHMGLVRGPWATTGVLPTIEGNTENSVQRHMRSLAQVHLIIRPPKP
jgi:hypothetical protein